MTTHPGLHPSFGPGRPALRFEPLVDLADGAVPAHEAIIGTGPRVGFGSTEGGAFDHVVRRVATRLRQWPAGTAASFNVTLAQLLDPAMPERIGEIAAGAGVEPRRFLFEIDATAAATDPSAVRRAVERLHEDAWSVTLDHVEAVTSPLRLVAVLPVDMVKIDQTAAQEASRDRLEVLAAVAATARWLGIGTVATGVRTLPELAAAIAHGFDLAQGPLFGDQIPSTRVSGEASGSTP